jgi:flagellar motor protein MotB
MFKIRNFLFYFVVIITCFAEENEWISLKKWEWTLEKPVERTNKSIISKKNLNPQFKEKKELEKCILDRNNLITKLKLENKNYFLKEEFYKVKLLNYEELLKKYTNFLKEEKFENNNLKRKNEYLKSSNLDLRKRLIYNDKYEKYSDLKQFETKEKILTVFFDLNSSKISFAEQQKLNVLSETLKNTEYKKIYIEGHTDELPLKNNSSNWELSLKRSLSVLNYLLKKNIPENVFFVGGYSKFKILDNVDSKKNRRVELYLLKN